MNHYLARLVSAVVCFAATVACCRAQEPLPAGFHASNVDVVAYNNLDDKPAFKMSVIRKGDKWYMYMGHFWTSGWTILDITDPKNTKIVKFIPGPPGSFTGQVDIHDDIMITGLQKPLVPGIGADRNAPFGEGVLIWNISDPVDPKLVGQFKTGGDGTHRNGYFGGKYMHLSSLVPGYSGNIYQIVDISDPAHPVEAGRWWVKGQGPGEKPAADEFAAMHGPAYVEGNLAYLPYGSEGLIILDISNVAAPKLVGSLKLSPPFYDRFAGHTVIPLPDRGIAIMTSEAIVPGCAAPPAFNGIIDIHDPTKPRVLSLFPLPIPPADMNIRSFCELKGSVFGSHNVNTLLKNPYVQPQGDLVYMTYWNAGLRIFDISSATAPREVGYFIPPVPRKRYGPFPRELAPQTEDVLVDTRGYIYITDNNQGLWILRMHEQASR